MSDLIPTVVVVGAGCAGALVAVGLLRRARAPLRVVLVERSGDFGPGVAYRTRDERHVLNVVAEQMGACEDDPGGFAAWARRRLGALPPASYLPRMLYGDYLRELLDDAARDAAPGARLERVTGEVVDVVPARHGATVVLTGGRRIEAAHVVLALGGLPTTPPVALPDDPRVVVDPWADGALADASPTDVTLVLGTGLTAVDVVLTLAGAGVRSRMIAVSRGGCLPFEQLPGLREPVPAPPLPRPPVTLERLERWLGLHLARMRREGHDWREVIDGVRPRVPELWQALPADERVRFIAARGRWWELRRHRMAPDVAAGVRRLLGAGRLLIRSGRVIGVRSLPRALEVLICTGADEVRTVRVDRVVLCTGPGRDVRRARSPLLAALLRRGVASADALGLGLRATPGGALLAPDGRVASRVHVIGALRRGELWETTAVREIRAHATIVAREVVAGLRAAPQR